MKPQLPKIPLRAPSPISQFRYNQSLNDLQFQQLPPEDKKVIRENLHSRLKSPLPRRALTSLEQYNRKEKTLPPVAPQTQRIESPSIFNNRGQTRQWERSNELAEQAALINNNLTDGVKLSSNFPVEASPEQRLFELQQSIREILSINKLDHLFGQDGPDDQPVLKVQDLVIQQNPPQNIAVRQQTQTNQLTIQDFTAVTVPDVIQPSMIDVEKFLEQQRIQIFENKENADEVELYSVSFDNCIQILLLNDSDSNQQEQVCDLLIKAKNYYINKIKSKATMEKAQNIALRKLDNQLVQASNDIVNLQQVIDEKLELIKDLHQKHAASEKHCATLQTALSNAEMQRDRYYTRSEQFSIQNVILDSEQKRLSGIVEDVNARLRRLNQALVKQKEAYQVQFEKLIGMEQRTAKAVETAEKADGKVAAISELLERTKNEVKLMQKDREQLILSYEGQLNIADQYSGKALLFKQHEDETSFRQAVQDSVRLLDNILTIVPQYNIDVNKDDFLTLQSMLMMMTNEQNFSSIFSGFNKAYYSLVQFKSAETQTLVKDQQIKDTEKRKNNKLNDDQKEPFYQAPSVFGGQKQFKQFLQSANTQQVESSSSEHQDTFTRDLPDIEKASQNMKQQTESVQKLIHALGENEKKKAQTQIKVYDSPIFSTSPSARGKQKSSQKTARKVIQEKIVNNEQQQQQVLADEKDSSTYELNNQQQEQKRISDINLVSGMQSARHDMKKKIPKLDYMKMVVSVCYASVYPLLTLNHMATSVDIQKGLEKISANGIIQSQINDCNDYTKLNSKQSSDLNASQLIQSQQSKANASTQLNEQQLNTQKQLQKQQNLIQTQHQNQKQASQDSLATNQQKNIESQFVHNYCNIISKVGQVMSILPEDKQEIIKQKLIANLFKHPNKQRNQQLFDHFVENFKTQFQKSRDTNVNLQTVELLSQLDSFFEQMEAVDAQLINNGAVDQQFDSLEMVDLIRVVDQQILAQKDDHYFYNQSELKFDKFDQCAQINQQLQSNNKVENMTSQQVSENQLKNSLDFEKLTLLLKNVEQSPELVQQFADFLNFKQHISETQQVIDQTKPKHNIQYVIDQKILKNQTQLNGNDNIEQIFDYGRIAYGDSQYATYLKQKQDNQFDELEFNKMNENDKYLQTEYIQSANADIQTVPTLDANLTDTVVLSGMREIFENNDAEFLKQFKVGESLIVGTQATNDIQDQVPIINAGVAQQMISDLFSDIQRDQIREKIGHMGVGNTEKMPLQRKQNLNNQDAMQYQLGISFGEKEYFEQEYQNRQQRESVKKVNISLDSKVDTTSIVQSVSRSPAFKVNTVLKSGTYQKVGQSNSNNISNQVSGNKKLTVTFEQFQTIRQMGIAGKSSLTTSTIKVSRIDLHPRHGSNQRAIQSMFRQPLLELFNVQHVTDQIYLKFYPRNDFVNPCLLRKGEFIHVQKQTELQINTKNYFERIILECQSKTEQVVQPDLPTILPSGLDKIKYIRLNSMSMLSQKTPSIFFILEELQNQPMQYLSSNEIEYLYLPLENCTIKSCNWTIRLIREILQLRSSQSIQRINIIEQKGGFVTELAQRIQTFEVVDGVLNRQQAENLAWFCHKFIMDKYGLKSLCLQLLYSFIVNLVYYQYENLEIYLFTRMLFEDLDADYFLFYLELRRVVNLNYKVGDQILEEKVAIEILPDIVVTIFKNWEGKRQYAFLQKLYATLYAQQHSMYVELPDTMNFPILASLLLTGYGTFRRTIYQGCVNVFHYLSREQQTSPLINEAGFRQLCQLVLPMWSNATVGEYYFEFSHGLSNNIAERYMNLANFSDFFQSIQMGRFAIVCSDILDKVTDIEIKKLIKNASFIYTKMYPVAKRIISMINRHLALSRGDDVRKYIGMLQGYLSIINCDILAYDFVSAIDGMKLLFSAALEAMIRMKPDGCIIAIGGAMTALEHMLGSGHTDE